MSPTITPPDTAATRSGRERTPAEEANMRTVVASYSLLLTSGAGGLYATDYRDHSAAVPSGDLEGLVAYVSAFHEEFPLTQIEIVRVLADGDFVIVHTRGRRAPQEEWNEIIELYRLQAGLIAEHWQVLEPAGLFATQGGAA